MLGQIITFLAVATSAAFANSYGFCYPGFGTYVNSVPFLNSGVCNNGFFGPRVLSTGLVTPVIGSEVYATPAFRAVGVPEVISSCENSIASPVVSTEMFPSGVYRSGSTLGGYRTEVIPPTVC